ncbi:exported hypothetical protein [Candidatus Sulfopaludibacter sp. SbA3]|nr:exported hypothetical protein [Candidatus Sulfopaludibacter sp. SbA3]
MGLSGSRVAFFVFTGWLGIAGAQTTVSLAAHPRTPANGLPPSNFRVDARLVQIPVTVTDGLDRNVMNLAPANFRVFEGDVEQQIAAFSMNDAPVSAGIVFDTSGSMKNRVRESRAAVQQFLGAAVPDDEFFLVRFSDAANLVSPFTRQPAEIASNLPSLAPRGWTALYDAVFLSVHQMRRGCGGRPTHAGCCWFFPMAKITTAATRNRKRSR